MCKNKRFCKTYDYLVIVLFSCRVHICKVDWTSSLMTRFTRRKPATVQHHFIVLYTFEQLNAHTCNVLVNVT